MVEMFVKSFTMCYLLVLSIDAFSNLTLCLGKKGAGFFVKLQFLLISNLFIAIVILFIMLPEERDTASSFRPSFPPSVQSHFSTTFGPNWIKLHMLYKYLRTLRLYTSPGFSLRRSVMEKGGF